MAGAGDDRPREEDTSTNAGFAGAGVALTVGSQAGANPDAPCEFPENDTALTGPWRGAGSSDRQARRSAYHIPRRLLIETPRADGGAGEGSFISPSISQETDRSRSGCPSTVDARSADDRRSFGDGSGARTSETCSDLGRHASSRPQTPVVDPWPPVVVGRSSHGGSLSYRLVPGGSSPCGPRAPGPSAAGVWEASRGRCGRCGALGMER